MKMKPNIIEEDGNTNESSQLDKTITQSTTIPEMSSNDCSLDAKKADLCNGENSITIQTKTKSIISNGNTIANSIHQATKNESKKAWGSNYTNSNQSWGESLVTDKTFHPIQNVTWDSHYNNSERKHSWGNDHKTQDDNGLNINQWNNQSNTPKHQGWNKKPKSFGWNQSSTDKFNQTKSWEAHMNNKKNHTWSDHKQKYSTNTLPHTNAWGMESNSNKNNTYFKHKSYSSTQAGYTNKTDKNKYYSSSVHCHQHKKRKFDNYNSPYKDSGNYSYNKEYMPFNQ